MMTKADPGAFILAGDLDDFVEDRFVIVDHPSGTVGVVSHQGTFYAVSNRCPHMGAPLCVGGGVKATTKAAGQPFDYETDDSVPLVRCPWHRWEFSLIDGTNAGNVVKVKIRTFPVRIEDGRVYVSRTATKRKEAA